MVRNKVQPYIVPSTELVDVVGKGVNASISVEKRGYVSEGKKLGAVRTPKRRGGEEM
jgi:hypothetical protein